MRAVIYFIFNRPYVSVASILYLICSIPAIYSLAVVPVILRIESKACYFSHLKWLPTLDLILYLLSTSNKKIATRWVKYVKFCPPRIKHFCQSIFYELPFFFYLFGVVFTINKPKTDLTDRRFGDVAKQILTFPYIFYIVL